MERISWGRTAWRRMRWLGVGLGQGCIRLWRGRLMIRGGGVIRRGCRWLWGLGLGEMGWEWEWEVWAGRVWRLGNRWG